MTTHLPSFHAKLLTGQSRNPATLVSMVGHRGDEMSAQKNTCGQMVFGTEAKTPGGCGQSHCRIEWTANGTSRFRTSTPFSQHQRGSARAWAGGHKASCAVTLKKNGRTDRQTDRLKLYGLVPLPKVGNPGLLERPIPTPVSWTS